MIVDLVFRYSNNNTVLKNVKIRSIDGFRQDLMSYKFILLKGNLFNTDHLRSIDIHEIKD